jgi:DNA-directed RNA polymerase subunit RPC12/RpoP
MSPIGQSKEAVHEAGDQTGAGSFLCVECSVPLSLDHAEAMPTCPNCGGQSFKRASLFEQPTLTNITVEPSTEGPAQWLEGVRSSITKPGKYLALYAGGRARVFEIDQGWSRIGRSSAADIRLDDPTVSRRHAVIINTPEGELRALDDRSMNGIAVNGDNLDWAPLADGDELQIGRYTLHVTESAGTPSA